MTDAHAFISVVTFADAARIGRRCAQKALRRAASGEAWRGQALEVRSVAGVGGRSGFVYEVCVASLPPDVASRLVAPIQGEMPLIVVSGSPKSWRRDLVRAIVAAGARGSTARSDAIRELSQVARVPNGKRVGNLVAKRTLRAWVAAFEREGDAGVTRGRRADKGKARVVAWRAWDAAMRDVGVSRERQLAAAALIVNEVRSLWACGACSASNVQFLATPDLRDIALAEAPKLTRQQLDAMCRMPAAFVRKYQRARLVHQKRSDAGGWAAKMVPRVRRDRSALKPMEMVAADVRHSDIMVRRADGSLATPKMIAFLDLATNRVFARVHIMNKGEMIGRKHVLAAFRDMFADPSWGVPQQLYLDNGSEFRTGPAADDLALIAQLVRDSRAIEMGLFDAGSLPPRSGRLLSRPYNPQSKVIEGVFSIFTRSIEPMYQGFVGGNRMAKKVENQGRAKQPMGGDHADIQEQFRQIVAFYNAKAQQKGHIKGLSPDQASTQHVDRGWQSIGFNPAEFALAFGTDDTRKVAAGGKFQCEGETYLHDELAMRAGERIRIRKPILNTDGRIPVLDDKGDVLCVAEIEQRYEMRDLAGAREQTRRNAELSRQVRAEGDGTPKVDLVAKAARAIAELPPVSVPAQLAVVSVHPLLREAAQEPSAPLRKVQQAEFHRRMNARQAQLEDIRRAG